MSKRNFEGATEEGTLAKSGSEPPQHVNKWERLRLMR